MKESDKDITLKEFKEAKASLRERIVDLVREELIDFHEKTGVSVCGHLAFNWHEESVCKDNYGDVISSVGGFVVACNLKTDL